MKFSPTTFTPLLAADAMQGDQAAAEEGLLMDELDQLRSGRAFGTSELSSVSHQITSLISVIY
jgi:hypothetical protein